MKIYIGADHRGFETKEKLKPWLTKLGHEVVDCGNTEHDPEDDFPDFSFAVGERVAEEVWSRGIIICGSGGGVTIAANKVPGIRCGLGREVADVKQNRTHNDINVLALASDYTSEAEIKKLIEVFLDTEFDGGEKYKRRIAKILAYESCGDDCCGGECCNEEGCECEESCECEKCDCDDCASEDCDCDECKCGEDSGPQHGHCDCC